MGCLLHLLCESALSNSGLRRKEFYPYQRLKHRLIKEISPDEHVCAYIGYKRPQAFQA